MLDELRRQVFAANLELEAKRLVIYTRGNVSGIDREHALVVIKKEGTL